MESITAFVTAKLKLKVNGAKSAVAWPWERKFLGFSFTMREPHRRSLAGVYCEQASSLRQIIIFQTLRL